MNYFIFYPLITIDIYFSTYCNLFPLWHFEGKRKNSAKGTPPKKQSCVRDATEPEIKDKDGDDNADNDDEKKSSLQHRRQLGDRKKKNSMICSFF